MVYSAATDAYCNALAWIKDFIATGAVDPDASLMTTFDAVREKVYRNQVGMIYFSWAEFIKPPYDQTLAEMTPDAEWIQIDSEELLNMMIDWGAPFSGDLAKASSDFSPNICALNAAGKGAAHTEFLAKKIAEDGLDVRTGTKATELIVKDGVVCGVMAEDSNSRYTIHAKAVLLATGGFGSNPELVAEYCPAYSEAIVS